VLGGFGWVLVLWVFWFFVVWLGCCWVKVSNGECTTIDSIWIKRDCYINIPNAFTPDGDGLNDFFEFDFLGATNLDISIWNRWGEAVYVNPNQPNGITGSNGWDGRKGGDLVPVDTYVYQLKVTYFNGLIKEKSGTVTITK
jgi:gliding motility-associated-like protein